MGNCGGLKLENPMGRKAWQAMVPRVTESDNDNHRVRQ